MTAAGPLNRGAERSESSVASRAEAPVTRLRGDPTGEPEGLGPPGDATASVPPPFGSAALRKRVAASRWFARLVGRSCRMVASDEALLWRRSWSTEGASREVVLIGSEDSDAETLLVRGRTMGATAATFARRGMAEENEYLCTSQKANKKGDSTTGVARDTEKIDGDD